MRKCANLRLEEIRPVEVILPEKWRKTLLSFSSCFTTRKGLYRQGRHLKPISLGQDLHQLTKQKNTRQRPLAFFCITPRRVSLIPPLSINILYEYSSGHSLTFNAHCTAHCTVENFNVKFPNPDAHFGDTKHRRSTVHGAAHACMAWPIYGSGSLVHVMSMCQLQEPREVTLRA